MRRQPLSIYLIVLIAIMVMSCETAGNIDSPDDSFFIKYFGNDGDQEGVDFVENTDGTLTLFGNTGISPNRQLYLVKVEPDGDLVWERTYGDAADDNAKDIELTNDGRLVIVSDYGDKGSRDIKIMTLTLDGNKIDSTLTGFPTGGTTDEIATSVTQTNDGFLVAGSTSNISIKPNDLLNPAQVTDTRDALHLRYFDNLQAYPSSWRVAHGPGDFDESIKIFQIAPDQYYFFGYSNKPIDLGPTSTNFYMLGLGEFGETNGDEFLINRTSSNEILTSVIISPPQSGDGFLLTGITEGAGGSDIYVVKLRKKLNFKSEDIILEKNLGADLSNIVDESASAFASVSSGFIVTSNILGQNDGQNFYLDKRTSDLNRMWSSPFIYGAELDDSVGSVIELQDGSIAIIGTFSIGQDGEKKMTLIKVNQEGKFLK